MNYRWFIIIGLVSYGIAGLLFAYGDSLIYDQGILHAAQERPQEFAALAVSWNFHFWAVRGILGIILEVVGTIAIFLALQKTVGEKNAFIGLLLCILGDLLGIILFAVSATITPRLSNLYLDGNIENLDIISPDGLPGLIMAGAGFATIIGLIFFAIAIWKTTKFPKWSGILIVIGFLLIPVPNYYIQIGASLIWTIPCFWMACYYWSKS